MTCIVAHTDGKNIWMGGDAATVSEHHAVDISRPKVFERFTDNRRVKWLIGYSGSIRVGQMLKYQVTLPAILKYPKKDIEEVISCNFMDSFLRRLEKIGMIKETEGVESIADGSHILIGLQNHLIIIDEDFQTIILQKPYAAIGLGGDYATGALCSIEALKPDIDPTRRLLLALNASHEHNAGIQKPFTIITTEKGIASQTYI